eukprot:scaffold203233_cov21-Tisochrysis_lutea.AAC.3
MQGCGPNNSLHNPPCLPTGSPGVLTAGSPSVLVDAMPSGALSSDAMEEAASPADGALHVRFSCAVEPSMQENRTTVVDKAFV